MPILTPRQAFEENMRPAELLLSVYRLLESPEVYTEHGLMNGLRAVLEANSEEDLLLLYNPIFLGVVREGAAVSRGQLKKSALGNLLRQSVAASCTALDTFLPSLLRANIATVIAAKRHGFLPSDGESKNFFKDINFELADVIRLLREPDPVLFITNRMLFVLKDRAAGNATAVHAIGCILDVSDPWKAIGDRLGRSSSELKVLLSDTVRRRNDIIHRADRAKTDPDGPMQEIALSTTMQSVDNIKHVCIALDELVAERMQLLPSAPAAA